MQTRTGRLIVGVSEHVTYWDSLGWTDPFSSTIYTDRQSAYARRFGLDSVYTPQIVINGAEQIVGNDRAGFLHAVEKEAEQPSVISLHIQTASMEGDSIAVTFMAVGESPVRRADIMAILVDDSDQSSVLRGENSGKTLSHVAVARSLTRVAKLQASGEQAIKIPLPSAFQRSRAHHLILFAQIPGSGRVLAVDILPL
ncbi:MAG: hypothetical protein NVSMB62_19170 [Acidobacteriaceae bacterium]